MTLDRIPLSYLTFYCSHLLSYVINSLKLLISLSAVQYNLGHRSVYSLHIHLVLVTKYRRNVITSAMLNRLHEIFDETCAK